LTIQIDAASDAFRSWAMDGRATLAMAPSRTARVMPRPMETMAHYRLGTGNPSWLTEAEAVWVSDMIAERRLLAKVA